MRIPIDNVGNVGLVKDIFSHELPPEAWTAVQNTRMGPHGAEKFLGHSRVLGSYNYINSGYATTPDSVNNSITGDFELRCYLALDDYTPAAYQDIFGKGAGGGQFSYLFRINQTNGALYAYWSADGTVLRAETVSAPAGLVDSLFYGWRVRVDTDNGAGGSTTRFYIRYDDDIESDSGWFQVGADQITAGTLAVFNSTALLEFGKSTYTGNGVVGKLGRALLYSGLDGAKVLKAECNINEATVGSTSTW